MIDNYISNHQKGKRYCEFLNQKGKRYCEFLN